MRTDPPAALPENYGYGAVAIVWRRLDLQRLRGMGCQYGQGYWFGRPPGAEDVAALILSGTAFAQ